MNDWRTREEAAIKIACIQMEPVIGEKERNVRRSLELVEDAAANGAHLLVLPELCNSGYVFDLREEAFALAEEIPNGPTCRGWQEAARKHNLHIVAGINERDGQVLYNASVVIGPAGHLGTFRKVHLWNKENLFFERGNLGFPVFRTPFGRIGTFICYDGWFPESFRLCALQGADIVCSRRTGFQFQGRRKIGRRWLIFCAWRLPIQIRYSSLPRTARVWSAASPLSVRVLSSVIPAGRLVARQAVTARRSSTLKSISQTLAAGVTGTNSIRSSATAELTCTTRCSGPI